jgi:hypothetical protein
LGSFCKGLLKLCFLYDDGFLKTPFLQICTHNMYVYMSCTMFLHVVATV